MELRPDAAAPRVTPGAPESRVLLHVPHAGTHLPAWVRAHLLSADAELAAEVAALTDHRTDALALAAAERAAVRPWVLVNPVSRFVVDVERFPDEREEMAAASASASVPWSVSAATSAANSASPGNRCARTHAGTSVPAWGTCSSTGQAASPGTTTGAVMRSRARGAAPGSAA